VVAGLISSCTGEVDDIFDKSSAQRAAEAIKTDRDILISAENGWVLSMKADPGDQLGFGVYNIYLKFNENDSVEISSELGEDSNTKISSHYKVFQSQGINLSFDEYNEFMHFFSDPTNTKAGGDVGQGLKGDFEFLIIKISKEEVILKGKKTGIKLRMIPVPNNVKWEDELNTIANVDENMTCYKNYYLIFNDTKDTIPVTRTFKTLYYNDADGNTITMPFITKTNGIEFFEPQNIFGHNITGFENNDEGLKFASFEDKSITLCPIIKPLLETFEANQWFFAKSIMSPTFSQAFDGCINASDNEGEFIAFAYLQMYNADTLAFCFKSYVKDFSGSYGGIAFYKFTKIDAETVKLEFAPTLKSSYGGDGSYYYRHGYNTFMEELAGTYKIATDNVKAPSLIIFRKEDNPDNYFIVAAQQIIYPADN
ncbi:MAG: DUF4302 domain-containing protein, partial [Bacteroidaceae bacterium]|nr:DUF4302 domain-containing protein [Bacteroidaceae bacterium]